MICSEQHNFTFVAIPKTGTRSMHEILQKKYGGVFHSKHEHRLDIPSYYKNKFVFTTVRNPYDRICSAFCFLNDNKGGVVHKEWLKFMSHFPCNQTDPLQSYLLAIRENGGMFHHPGISQSYYFKHIEYSRVLKLEHLEDHFSQLPFVTDYEKFSILNKSSYKSHRELLTSSSISLVNEIYQEDFEMFDYPMVGSK